MRQDHNRFAHSFFKSALKAGSCALLALSISACSINVPKFSVQGVDPLVTSSLKKTGKLPNIHQTDAEVIKTIMTSSENPEVDIEKLVWNNSDTGNSGTIITIENFFNPDNQKCKNFRATVNSFTGVLLYDGQACETKTDFWTLSSFKQL